jgi:hypothetical protein
MEVELEVVRAPGDYGIGVGDHGPCEDREADAACFEGDV